MMKHLLIIFLLLVSYASFGQNAKIDSLEKVLKNYQKEDTLKVLTLGEYSYYLQTFNPKLARQKAKESLKLSQKLNYISGIGNSWVYIGLSYHYEGKAQKGLEYIQKALQLGKKQDDYAMQAGCLANIAFIYSETGQGNEAIKSYLEASKLCRKFEKYEEEARMYRNVSLSYIQQNNYIKATQYALKSLKISETHNDIYGKIRSLERLTQISTNQQNYVKSLKYHNKIIKYAKQTGDDIEIAYANFGLATTLGNLKKYPKAIKKYKTAIKIFENTNENYSLARCYGNLGMVFKKQGKTEKATQYLTKSNTIALKYNYGRLLADNNLSFVDVYTKNQDSYEIEKIKKLLDDTKLLIDSLELFDLKPYLMEYYADYYEKIGNYKQALIYQKDFKVLNDSIFNTEKNKTIQELQTKYETEKKEQENKLLKNKERLNESELKRKNTFILALIAFGSIASIFTFLVVRLWVRERKAKKQVKIQNNELAQKNEEIEQQSEEIKAQRDTIQRLSGSQRHTIDDFLKMLYSLLEGKDEQIYIKAIEAINAKLFFTEASKDILIKESDIQQHFQDIFEHLQVFFEDKAIYITQDITINVLTTSVLTFLSHCVIEATINAYKYAYMGVSNPEFRMVLQDKTPQGLVCTLADNGIGIQAAQKRKGGQGLKLMQTFAQKFNATIETTYNHGTVHRITT